MRLHIPACESSGRWVAVITLLLGCAPAPDNRPPADSAAAVIPQPRLPHLDNGAAQLPPADQADASFRSFRETALKALSARDTAYLYSILTPDIKNSFGGDDSIAGFRRIWKMAEPGTAVWTALSRVLRMGGKLVGDSTFIAPYVYAFWPDSVDAFEYVSVTTPDAAFHADPASAPIGRLSHSILKVEEWRNPGEAGVPSDSTWARLTLPDGRTGWVKGVDVYSPVGWRAFFVKRNQRWLLQFFVAGD